MLPRRQRERTDIMDHVTRHSQPSDAITISKHMHTYVRSCKNAKLLEVALSYMLKFQ